MIHGKSFFEKACSSFQGSGFAFFCFVLTLLVWITGCNELRQEDFYAEPVLPTRNIDCVGLPEPFDRNAFYIRELHVSPQGSDDTGDGSKEAPFATLRRASREAAPGTRIHLAKGRYAPAGSLAGLTGEPGLPIAIVGHKDAVIDGSLAEGIIPGIHLSRPSHVVLKDLNIINAYPHGVSIDDGGDLDSPAGPVILQGLRIADIGQGGNNDCLKLSGVKDFQVLDSEFSGCNTGEAIDMVGCHEGLISGNTFRDMPGSGVQTKGGSSHVIIHANRFINIAMRSVNMGGHTGTPYFRPPDAGAEALHIQVLNNIFFRSGDTAIAFVGCIDCLAAHNTIIDPQGHAVRLLEENPELAIGRGSRFINNLVSFRSSELKGYIDAGRRVRADTFALGWNLWHARNRENFPGPVHGHSIPPEQYSISVVDPLFIDPASGDYRLQPDSPAIGRGLDLPEITLPDYHGRAMASPPAIGAMALP